MNFNNFLSKLFGNKSQRDMKAIQPWVEKIKEAYPAIEALDNDALRARTQEIRQQVQAAAKTQKEEIEKLKYAKKSTTLRLKTANLSSTALTKSKKTSSNAMKRSSPSICPMYSLS